MENKIKEIKKKKIENMTTEELKFIIENDKSLIAFERLDYKSELLKRAIKNNDFSDFTLYQINRKDV